MGKNLNITKPSFRKHLALRYFEFNSISFLLLLLLFFLETFH